MLQITDIKLNARVKIVNNVAVADNVYLIEDVILTERGLRLQLVLEDDKSIHNDVKPTEVVLA